MTNKKNNKENFSNSKITLYFTEWCGYSKSIMPHWDEFSKEMDGKISIEKIDCEKQKDKCSNIPGYPTIIITRDSGEQVMMDEKYKRTKDGLIKFVNKVG